MDNDFTYPEAVAVLFDLANEINRARSTALARQLRALGGLLGLLGGDSETFLRAGTGGEISEVQIGALIAERNEARRARNFGVPTRSGTSCFGRGPDSRRSSGHDLAAKLIRSEG